ncbi:hypothetical protein [Helicobacter sp. 13S00477-4]|uniref:hypothetical protein n=1 Tax=Helicobacter sp. 13S00477-4 TaxID=1905759 RepID=UPI00117B585C|nr:hypothetical protein [Helicobacter sp. 13S00477-4]
MSSFVYKIKRNYVEFSSEDNHTFRYYQPNQKQVLEISRASGLEEILQANEKLLRENLEILKLDSLDSNKLLSEEEARVIKNTFINELLENSTLEDFFNAMNEEFIKQKEIKRKN